MMDLHGFLQLFLRLVLLDFGHLGLELQNVHLWCGNLGLAPKGVL